MTVGPISAGCATCFIGPMFLSESELGVGARGLESLVFLRCSCQDNLRRSLIGNTDVTYIADGQIRVVW